MTCIQGRPHYNVTYILLLVCQFKFMLGNKHSQTQTFCSRIYFWTTLCFWCFSFIRTQLTTNPRCIVVPQLWGCLFSSRFTFSQFFNFGFSQNKTADLVFYHTGNTIGRNRFTPDQPVTLICTLVFTLTWNKCERFGAVFLLSEDFIESIS